MTVTRAGDVDYGKFGAGYAFRRRADPRIAVHVHQALGNARIVLNVGAGAGSYEPEDREVIAVEPSEAMRVQRPKHLAQAIDAIAEQLPLADQSVDASMALVTVHQWRDLDKGLAELRRVTRGPIVVMTFDGDALDLYWLAQYVPELIAVERGRYPKMQKLCDALGPSTEVQVVPVPIDCTDGFTEAFYARPEAFLDPAVRRSQSAWSFVPESVQSRFVKTLADDLKSGAWDRKYGEWRTRPHFEGSLRLIVGRPVGCC
ncbi:MAG TPA: methyltransferase domain-containing protein [Verrucomicrobiae bacterium]|nr:methyltransferase domain-containing protein [Verrucomicrobiae bacterium]